MADKETSADATWLPVIGRTLAYLCMKSAAADGAFKSVLDKIKFLENLGLPTEDAAKVAGSTKASVVELRRLKKAGSSGKAKKKRGR